LFRGKQQLIVEQAPEELDKLKAKLQMEENLVEKLTAIRDALERGKLIHRFEALGKGPKLREHLLLMDRNGMLKKGNVKQELKQDLKQRKLRWQEWSKKSSTHLSSL
jgi:hypothetical protein